MESFGCFKTTIIVKHCIHLNAQQGLWLYSFCNYSMHIDNLKIIKANITQILEKEISRINIPQVDKRKFWKAYHEKKINSTLWTKISTTFNEKKIQYLIKKKNLKITLWTKFPIPQMNKRSQKHIFKNSIAICEEIIEHHGQAKNSWALCLFKLFAHGANCELEGCNSTIAKVTMGFKLWAALLRSSMSKDFKWHSGSSCLQNGEGEKLKQISQTLTNASFCSKTSRNWENSAMMLRNEMKQNIKEKETNQNTPEEMV